MTSSFHYRGKERFSVSPLHPQRLMATVTMVTLTGGMAGAVLSLILGKNDLALGFFLGSILSIVNFYGLKILAERVLRTGDQKGKRSFWFWNIIRWALFAFVFWFLLMISNICLLGAVSSYLWFLAVLGWIGWRSASFQKSS